MVLLLAQAGPELVNLHSQHSDSGGVAVCVTIPVCAHLLTSHQDTWTEADYLRHAVWLVLADD